MLHWFRRPKPSTIKLALLVTTALAMPAVAAAQQVQTGSIFNQQGPGPAIGPRNTVGSADSPPNGTVTGAIQSIAADPTDPNTVYAGAVNGGIWRTTNGGTTWTSLTDTLASLSIASLALDPTDATRRTLVAGVGNTSNGGYTSISTFSTPGNFGGVQNGLLYSTDGGATFTHLGGASLSNQSVVDVAARGSTILAATFEPRVTTAGGNSFTGGLYRSANGGTSFTLVSGAAGTGLPPGPVTSMVGDPTNPNTFYAAVTANSGATFNQTAVYRSTDGGATWTAVFTAANSDGTITAGTQTTIKLAAGPNGTIAVGVVDVGTRALSGLFYSNASGGSWTHLSTPNVNSGGQAPVNIALAIDPNSPNLVYVAGDNRYDLNGGINALAIVRVNATVNSISLMGDDTSPPVNTANGSTIHPDGRALVFDASGRLLAGVDGGIYARTNPQNSTGIWLGLNTSLATMELYSVAYDANSKRMVIAAQDNGTSMQASPGGLVYNQLQAGDGVNARVNDRSHGTSSAIYTTTQNLGQATRWIVDSSGNITHTASVDFIGGVAGAYFSSPLVLNNVDPTRMAVAGSDVYVTQDNAALNAGTVNLTMTNVGATGQVVTAIDYGTVNNTNAVLAGSGNYDDLAGRVYISTTGGAASLVQTAGYGGMAPTSVRFDTRSDRRFFVADSLNLYGTVNQGTNYTLLTGNLPASFIRPTSLGFINANGVAALLVGGLNNADNAGNPIVVADSDGSGNLSGWRRFGSGLPNATVYDLSYNSRSDTLAVGTVGRGAFLLYDVTSNFASATVLQFGLADNDSIPDASILTGNRPLIKYGTGTLLISGDASYTGGTTINAGAVILGNGGTAGSILGDVVNNGIFAFNRSDTYTFGGQISGTGSLQQIGTGVTVLTANETYTGATTVFSGGLIVNGSIASSSGLVVNPGALVGGYGTLPSTTVNGILSPGNSIGTITVAGNLTFGAGSIYLVEVSPTTADRTNVTGTAALAGTVLTTGAAGQRAYTILHANGGLTGTFGTVITNLPSYLAPSLSYSASDVFLNFTLGLGQIPGLNINQAAVARALDTGFNTGSGFTGAFANLLGLPSTSMPFALTQLSGEIATGTAQASFRQTDQFLDLMLDPYAGTRASDPTALTSPALGYAPHKPSSAGSAAINNVVKAPPLVPDVDPRWRVWGGSFGGTGKFNGDASTGSHDLSVRNWGAATGADYRWAPNALIGFALAGGETNFSLGSLGNGRSDVFQLGGYGSYRMGPAYVSAAVSYGAFDTKADRTIVIPGVVDKLNAAFTGQAVGGRLETGWRFGLPFGVGLTPYGAVTSQSFRTPSYNEADATALAAFALRYGSNTTTDTRSELGSRFDATVWRSADVVFNLRGRLAWSHDFSTERGIGAAFVNLPATGFTVFGAAPARDAALVSAGAELKLARGFALRGSFDGQFGGATQVYSGMGSLSYQW